MKINGIDKPLNDPLETGQMVEIVTQPDAMPERKWLDAELGMSERLVLDETSKTGFDPRTTTKMLWLVANGCWKNVSE